MIKTIITIIIIIIILFCLGSFSSYGSGYFSAEGFEQKISYPTDFPSWDDFPVKYPYYGREMSYLRYWMYPLGDSYPAEPYFYASSEFPMPPCGGWQKKI